MHKLLFLDIDGVLNNHTPHANGYCGINPECVARLNWICHETGAAVVVSSAWRYLMKSSMSLEGFRYMLMTYGLAEGVRIVGRTEFDEAIPDRGSQIWHYLHHAAECWPTPEYVVIDDGSDIAPTPPATMTLTESLRLHHADRWVQTDSAVGLRDDDATRAIAILNGSAAGLPAAGGEEPKEATR